MRKWNLIVITDEAAKIRAIVTIKILPVFKRDVRIVNEESFGRRATASQPREIFNVEFPAQIYPENIHWNKW